MSDIRWISLSDLHLGERNSLLSDVRPGTLDVDPLSASPTMKALVDCLCALVVNQDSKPNLVLHGDILEFATAPARRALMVFERFVQLTLVGQDGQDALFDKVVYVPGNHDHHIWVSARETQYVEALKHCPTGSGFPDDRHTTRAFAGVEPPVQGYVLTELVRRFPSLKDAAITTAYPNFGIVRPDGSKAVLWTHGHFIDPLYRLMSELNTIVFPDSHLPEDVEALEQENYAWIDFFWSTMGQTGAAGAQMGRIWDRVQDKSWKHEILDNIAKSLAKRFTHTIFGDRIEEQVFEWLLPLLVDRLPLERDAEEAVLSQGAQNGLVQYVEGPLRKQVSGERGSMPEEVTLVLGHTHKPFFCTQPFKGYPQSPRVYNTGAWSVDGMEPRRLHGASLVLIDEDLNDAAVRFYNEGDRPENYRVRVESAEPRACESLSSDSSAAGGSGAPPESPNDQPAARGGASNPLRQHLLDVVDPDQDPWKSFSRVVRENVQERLRLKAERQERIRRGPADVG